jgi:heat-inducible transcriptional repressor
MIGPENVAEELKDSSVIVASYDAGDNMKGLIGVVGPTRIDYATIAAKLSLAQGLSELLAAGGSVTPQIQSDIIKALGKGDE